MAGANAPEPIGTKAPEPGVCTLGRGGLRLREEEADLTERGLWMVPFVILFLLDCEALELERDLTLSSCVTMGKANSNGELELVVNLSDDCSDSAIFSLTGACASPRMTKASRDYLARNTAR